MALIYLSAATLFTMLDIEAEEVLALVCIVQIKTLGLDLTSRDLLFRQYLYLKYYRIKNYREVENFPIANDSLAFT